jgi:hypothetical protein
MQVGFATKNMILVSIMLAFSCFGRAMQKSKNLGAVMVELYHATQATNNRPPINGADIQYVCTGVIFQEWATALFLEMKQISVANPEMPGSLRDEFDKTAKELSQNVSLSKMENSRFDDFRPGFSKIISDHVHVLEGAGAENNIFLPPKKFNWRGDSPYLSLFRDALNQCNDDFVNAVRSKLPPFQPSIGSIVLRDTPYHPGDEVPRATETKKDPTNSDEQLEPSLEADLRREMSYFDFLRTIRNLHRSFLH